MARDEFKSVLTRLIPEPAERATDLLAATFAIDHLDLFGLRQVTPHCRGRARTPLRFVKRAMDRFSRHPIQTGVLIGIWATPEMTMTQLPLSVGFTLYIFVGLWFEEKDLVKEIGQPYLDHRREAGMFLPRLPSSFSSPSSAFWNRLCVGVLGRRIELAIHCIEVGAGLVPAGKESTLDHELSNSLVFTDDVADRPESTVLTHGLGVPILPPSIDPVSDIYSTAGRAVRAC